MVSKWDGDNGIIYCSFFSVHPGFAPIFGKSFRQVQSLRSSLAALEER
jgi:hypothetical protein